MKKRRRGRAVGATRGLRREAALWAFGVALSVAAPADGAALAWPRAALERLAPGVELGAVQARSGAARFEQISGRLPVLGRGLVEADWASAQRAVAAVDLELDLPSGVTPRLSRGQALLRAQPFTRMLLGPSDAKLVIHAGPRGARLAYLLRPGPRAGVPTSPRLVVDALDGRVLEARDTRRAAFARVYPANPVSTPALEWLPLALAPSGGSLQAPELSARSCVDRGERRALWLDGAERLVPVCSPEHTARPDAAGDFSAPELGPVTPPGSGDGFAEISAYHHAARAYAFFQRLGDGQPPFAAGLSIIADVRVAEGLLDGDDELAGAASSTLAPLAAAMYLPGDAAESQLFSELYGVAAGALWLGQGARVDFAYDGDVIYHELTHVLLESTLPAGGFRWTPYGVSHEPEALSEALADYFAAALSGDARIGEYAAAESPGSARSLDNDARCPSSLSGIAHADSLIVSGALWRVRQSLAEDERESFDRAVYRALLLSPGRRDTGFEELAALLLAATEATLPSALQPLADELETRGMLEPCESIVPLWPDVPLVAPSVGFLAPGTDATATLGLSPGVLQLRVEVPSAARHLTLDFSAIAIVRSPLFGRAGAEFAPEVLASWDAPLAWGPSAGGWETSADARVAASAGSRADVEVLVPEGVTVAYLQIVNAGAGDGLYDRVTVRFREPVASPPAAPSGSCAMGRERAPATPAPALLLAALLPAALLLALRRATSVARSRAV